jgi:ABC-2 type transport system permease protein
LELLLTMPITPWQAIVGKFIASWAFLAIVLILTFPVVLTVNWLGSPDNGVIFTAYLGSFLMAGAYLAISCVSSAITRNQVISFILAVVACLLLVLCGYPPVTQFFARMDNHVVDIVAGFSSLFHFENSFMKGVIDSRDVIYFCSIIFFALFSTGVIIRGHRAG